MLEVWLSWLYQGVVVEQMQAQERSPRWFWVAEVTSPAVRPRSWMQMGRWTPKAKLARLRRWREGLRSQGLVEGFNQRVYILLVP
jgi:hypothetical protein